MEQITIENLSFSYSLCDRKAVNNVSLSVKNGEFVVLCGKSGCGKTTLLKQLKKELAPHGEKSGKIFIDGKNIDEIDLKESAEKIGFVMQNPELQIVTDKVWHELAFGLENLGFHSNTIGLRTAEMASYFGIGQWYNKKTTLLSGGQKQIMNLASVMVMHPDVLLLDEPTSQLDPVSAENFLHTVSKINRELGVTVIITEQRLEEVFAIADRAVVMDEGKIIFDGEPADIGKELQNMPEFLRLAVPTPMRIFSSFAKEKCPVTVCEGRAFLREIPHKNQVDFCEENADEIKAVELKDVCFRYEKNGRDILKNLSLKIPQKSFFAILGGNGAGKTTLIKIITGSLEPFSGKVKIFGEKQKKSNTKICALPQDVQALFTEKSVLLDLKTIEKDEQEILKISRLVKIENLLEKHPFDLSGGEQQRAALAKVLLCKPQILLLDEPTKGMDAEFKNDFADIVASLKKEGCTVVMISHDVEFCAKYADKCAMIFDGAVVASENAHKFFNENRFYTTSAARMARGIIKNAVTDEDIILCLNQKSSQ
ncbi:MAG: ATP-binding cassette domain-containing protein [Clostridia bacterium]|nr:ATP-binding cassette domain-containing protein [Clostridia bacterium]